MIYRSLWCHIAPEIWTNIGSCNGLLHKDITWTNVDNCNPVLWHLAVSRFTRCAHELKPWHVFGDYNDDVIKWKHFPRYWPFVRGIHRSPVNSLHIGQCRGALMLSLIWAWINGWVNNGAAGDLRRHLTHYYVIVRHHIITTISLRGRPMN